VNNFKINIYALKEASYKRDKMRGEGALKVSEIRIINYK